MLNDCIAERSKNLPVGFRCLFNDAGVGNGIMVKESPLLVIHPIDLSEGPLCSQNIDVVSARYWQSDSIKH